MHDTIDVVIAVEVVARINCEGAGPAAARGSTVLGVDDVIAVEFDEFVAVWTRVFVVQAQQVAYEINW